MKPTCTCLATCNTRLNLSDTPRSLNSSLFWNTSKNILSGSINTVYNNWQYIITLFFTSSSWVSDMIVKLVLKPLEYKPVWLWNTIAIANEDIYICFVYIITSLFSVYMSVQFSKYENNLQTAHGLMKKTLVSSGGAIHRAY